MPSARLTISCNLFLSGSAACTHAMTAQVHHQDKHFLAALHETSDAVMQTH